ncbi:MAG: hypothetical protein AB1664_03350 [Thermodesulfobacteriota bacterium]
MGWKEIIRSVVPWVLPPKIADLLRTRLIVRTVPDPELKRNQALFNRHAGQQCFILATGPSIRSQDLTILQGEICIGLSNFFVHPDFAAIQPAYYCSVGHHDPLPMDGWTAWLAELASATKGSTLFFGLGERVRIRANSLYDQDRVYFVQLEESGDSISMRRPDLTRPIPMPQSVTIMALSIALYMGFQRIYLLGCDHDWLLHLGESSHFYEEREHAVVRAGYDEWSGLDLEQVCFSHVVLWRQYKALKAIAASLGAEIFNATPSGLLDIFPRVRLESLFPPR